MEIVTIAYGPESGILMLKCRGLFGVGSKGQPSGELLARTIEHWIAEHAGKRLNEIEVDYSEVDYAWGDWPVSSMVLFLRHGVERFHLVAGPANYAALRSLVEGCNLPWFRLSCAGEVEVGRVNISSRTVRSATTPAQQERWTNQAKVDSDPLDVLENAISDVGYWRRWTAHPPDWVQLEFGGVQLAMTEIGPSLPRPVEALGLRFHRPLCVLFPVHQIEWEQIASGRGDIQPDLSAGCNAALQRGPSPPEELAVDWPQRLQLERSGPLGISHDMFTFQDVQVATAIMAEATAVHALIGTWPTPETWANGPARLAFWAGAAGALIAAEEMEILVNTAPVFLDDVERMHRAWFDYWKHYWKRRGRTDALPTDWTCEVTIRTRDALE
jgi:hypothetical protein